MRAIKELWTPTSRLFDRADEGYPRRKVLDLQVGASLDDTYSINTAANYETSANLYFGKNGVGQATNSGFRFQVNASGTVDVAYATIYINSGGYDDPDGDIYFQAADSAENFNDANTVLHSRTRTAASVNWVASTLGIGWKNSPSLVTPLQEVFDRAGWAANNYVVVIMIGTLPSASTKEAQITAYDGDTSLAAKLHIEYTTPSGGKPYYYRLYGSGQARS